MQTTIESHESDSLLDTIKNKLAKNSDVLNFTLGIFIGLTVVNTADLLANATLTVIGSISYFTTKAIGGMMG